MLLGPGYSVSGLPNDLCRLRGMTYRVAEESWTPSSVNTTEAFSTANLTPSLEIPSVHFRVDLTTAFDEIERRYGRVSDTTSQETSESTCCVVLGRVQFNITSLRLSNFAGFGKLLLSLGTELPGLALHIINGTPGWEQSPSGWRRLLGGFGL